MNSLTLKKFFLLFIFLLKVAIFILALLCWMDLSITFRYSIDGMPYEVQNSNALLLASMLGHAFLIILIEAIYFLICLLFRVWKFIINYILLTTSLIIVFTYIFKIREDSWAVFFSKEAGILLLSLTISILLSLLYFILKPKE